MAIRKFRAGQSSYSADTYVGTRGTLFYDEDDGELRLSDGVTPGGVAISVRANLITAGSLVPDVDNDDLHDLGSETRRWHHLYIGDGGIKFDGDQYPTAQTVPYLPGAQVNDIVPATDNGVDLGATDKRFNALYLGQDGLYLADQTLDTNINITVDEGTLYIDGAENLRLGNLAIRDTTLTSATTDLDISIGNTNDTGFFYINRKAQIDNTTFSSTEAMLSINASGTTEPATLFPDTLLQLTSRPNKNSRVVQRSYGSSGNAGGDNSYAVWASYAARGNIATPSALKENDILMRLSANGYGATTFGSGGGARMEMVALEDFTDTAKGSRINFWTTPAGQVASQNVASINAVGIITTGVEFANDNSYQTTAGIPLTQKAIPSAAYVATLGSDGKLDASQIPSSLSGAIVLKGSWNAFTNVPELSDVLPPGVQAGWEYVVTVGGTRNIGDGEEVFVAGDFVLFDGTHWKRIASANNLVYATATGGTHIKINGNQDTQEIGVLTLTSDATPLSTNNAIVSRDASGNFSANVITANLTGAVTGTVSGNAGTVTNGVYTISDQTIGGSKTFTSTIIGNISGNAGTVTNGFYTSSSFNLGTTSIAINRSSATQSLTGINIDGSAGSSPANTLTGTTLNSTVVASSLTSVGALTNLTIAANGTITTPRIVINDGGIRTVSGGTTLTINFATDSIILWTAPSGTAAITLQNYTAGASVKLIIALTTTRDITYGIAGNANSSTGSDNWNGAGAGSVDIANTAVHLNYTCISGLAAGCYVSVTVN